MDINDSIKTIETNLGADQEDSVKKIKSENEKTTSAFLIFAVAIANLNSLMLGITVVWISPVTSKLLSYDVDENPLGRPVNTIELSLIGSLSQTGMVIGPVLLEKLFDQFGRKRCVNIISSLIVACYVVLAFSRHIYLYYAMILSIGILLGGITVGMSMYVSEITEDHNRGQISCYMGSFMPIGNLYGFLLGPFLTVKIFTLLCTIPAAIAIIISVLYLPESPQYLINKGQTEEALKVLKTLISNDLRAEKVANQMLFNTKTDRSKKSIIKTLFSNKSSRNGLIVCCVLSSMTAFTGIASIMSFLEPIFEASGTQVSGSISAIVVGVLQIACFFMAGFLVDRWGRRTLLLYSSMITIIPLTILGVYFYLININSPLVEHLRWVPIVGILSLVITSVTGATSVAMAVLNEVFTSDVKSIAMSFVYFLSGIFIAGSIFLLPIMMKELGLEWSFWMFAVLCFFSFLFIYFRVPETKDKNILEIQELLAK